MSEDFKSNEFDEYAYIFGGWVYDNGWRYGDEFFSAAYRGEEFDGTESGKQDYLLMLRRGNIPGRTLILHNIEGRLTQIWSGQVETKDDFNNMMTVANSYINQYQAQKKDS